MKNSALSIQQIVTARNAAFLTLAVVSLFAASFQSGRWTQRVVNRGRVFREQTESRAELSKKSNYSESADLESVLIMNVATVGFDELRDVLHSAPNRKRAQWIQELEAMPDGAQKTAALRSFYKTFVQIDLEAATASIETLHDVDAKMTAAEATVGAAPASGLQHVAGMLLKLPREFVSTHSWDYLNDVFQEWSWIDPEALARFFDQHPNDDLENYHGALIFNWAQLDPDAARAWLERQPPPKDKELFPPFEELVSGWFEKDHIAAENYLIAHADEEKLQGLIGRIASGAFVLSPEAARSFINRLPNDELKKQALDEIAHVADSVSWPNDWNRPPSVVANWMLTFPGAYRGNALASVIENWKEHDPDGLNTWIHQLSPSVRDQVALDYCYNFGIYDAEFLIPLVMNVFDSRAREAAILDFLGKWLPSDNQDASEKIRGSQLTDAEKSYLLKLLPRVEK